MVFQCLAVLVTQCPAAVLPPCLVVPASQCQVAAQWNLVVAPMGHPVDLLGNSRVARFPGAAADGIKSGIDQAGRQIPAVAEHFSTAGGLTAGRPAGRRIPHADSRGDGGDGERRTWLPK